METRRGDRSWRASLGQPGNRAPDSTRPNQAGYDVGRVDGQWDQQTARAVQDFQRSLGLEPTRTLTTSLLASIGQSNWMQGQIGGDQSTGDQGGGQQQSCFGQSSGRQGGQQQDGFAQSSGSQGGQSRSQGGQQ